MTVMTREGFKLQYILVMVSGSLIFSCMNAMATDGPSASVWPKMKQLYDDEYWKNYCADFEDVTTRKELKQLYIGEESWFVHTRS